MRKPRLQEKKRCAKLQLFPRKAFAQKAAFKHCSISFEFKHLHCNWLQVHSLLFSVQLMFWAGLQQRNQGGSKPPKCCLSEREDKSEGNSLNDSIHLSVTHLYPLSYDLHFLPLSFEKMRTRLFYLTDIFK